MKKKYSQDNFWDGGENDRIWSIEEYDKVITFKSSNTNTGIHTSTRDSWFIFKAALQISRLFGTIP